MLTTSDWSARKREFNSSFNFGAISFSPASWAARKTVSRSAAAALILAKPIEPLLPTFLEDGHAALPATEWRASAEELVASREVRDIDELDTAETAAALGVTANAVKIRLHRARQALRELLAPHFVRGEIS